MSKDKKLESLTNTGIVGLGKNDQELRTFGSIEIVKVQVKGQTYTHMTYQGISKVAGWVNGLQSHFQLCDSDFLAVVRPHVHGSHLQIQLTQICRRKVLGLKYV